MQKSISCGAILFTKIGHKVHIILGKESTGWLPFKGGKEGKNETLEETAIREIYEETCGVVKLEKIDLKNAHIFSSKRKIYYIALVYVRPEIVKKYYNKKKEETRKAYLEKSDIKMFPLSSVLEKNDVHRLSKKSIVYFWEKLNMHEKKALQRLL